jgi:transposase
VAISAGNEHDSVHFAAVAEKIQLKGIRGRSKRRPCEINADTAFDTEDIRIYLRKRGIKANIPVNKRNRKQPKLGRPFRFDKASYANRAAVERFNSWIESFKRILVRFERLKVTFLAFVNLACMMILWRVLK